MRIIISLLMLQLVCQEMIASQPIYVKSPLKSLTLEDSKSVQIVIPVSQSSVLSAFEAGKIVSLYIPASQSSSNGNPVYQFCYAIDSATSETLDSFFGAPNFKLIEINGKPISPQPIIEINEPFSIQNAVPLPNWPITISSSATGISGRTVILGNDIGTVTSLTIKGSNNESIEASGQSMIEFEYFLPTLQSESIRFYLASPFVEFATYDRARTGPVSLTPFTPAYPLELLINNTLVATIEGPSDDTLFYLVK